LTTSPKLAGLVIGWLLLTGCETSTSMATRPPSLDGLVNAHLDGRYEEVLRWCPLHLAEPLSEPRASDWCLYGLPAAMWLAFDTTGALAMLRAVCTDVPTGKLRGNEEFRSYYAIEVVRWFAMPLRMQRREELLLRARGEVVEQVSEVCGLDPRTVSMAASAPVR
jgi:hypothetical protein